MKTSKAATILIVDDEERNVKLLGTLLKAEGYVCLGATSGEVALDLTLTEKPDLILDVMMSEMDGFETVARLKADPQTRPVPVIMVTALDDRDSKMRALEFGAEEFLTKPVDRADLKVRVRNLLRLEEYSDFLADHNKILEEQVKQRTEQLATAYRDTVLTLVRAAEHKDESTGHHVRRISHYCRALAKAMDQTGEFSESIFHASPMHDIGKIGIPDHVLLKASGFTAAEWLIMRTHCALGRASSPPAPRPTLTWARRSRRITTSAGTEAAIPTDSPQTPSRSPRGSGRSATSTTPCAASVPASRRSARRARSRSSPRAMGAPCPLTSIRWPSSASRSRPIALPRSTSATSMPDRDCRIV